MRVKNTSKSKKFVGKLISGKDIVSGTFNIPKSAVPSCGSIDEIIEKVNEYDRIEKLLNDMEKAKQ